MAVPGTKFRRRRGIATPKGDDLTVCHKCGTFTADGEICSDCREANDNQNDDPDPRNYLPAPNTFDKL